MSRSSRPSDLFPRRLRAARKHRRLSQGELAGRSGLQASAISHFERTDRKPSLDNLRRLAEALNVSTDYLLGRTTEMHGASTHPYSLHRHYVGLSSEHQEVLEEFARLLALKNRKAN